MEHTPLSPSSSSISTTETHTILEREMKRRVVKGPPSSDLLVCFPTRSHLTLMPKTISSPSRSSNHHHRGKSIGDGGGLWCKTNHTGSESSEPTSPKVTCAGQIKGRSKSGTCRNWQTVMEDIETLHNAKNPRKKALGLKKESMQFLTSLRSFKFDLGCFGAIPTANVTSDDDEEDDDDHKEINREKKVMGFRGCDPDDRSSRSAFSKFFMVLEKNQASGLLENEEPENPKDDDHEAQSPCMPPSNALLLMRCRSAPAKSWLEQKEEEEEEDNDNGELHEDGGGMKMESLMEVMKYEGDFYKLSCDIAKETWVVGGVNKDPFSRIQSSKRCSTECLQEVKDCLR